TRKRRPRPWGASDDAAEPAVFDVRAEPGPPEVRAEPAVFGARAEPAAFGARADTGLAEDRPDPGDRAMTALPPPFSASASARAESADAVARPRWERPAFLGLLAATALLYLVNLSSSGW